MNFKERKETFGVPHTTIKMRPGCLPLKPAAIVLSDPNFIPKYPTNMLYDIIRIHYFLIW